MVMHMTCCTTAMTDVYHLHLLAHRFVTDGKPALVVLEVVGQATSGSPGPTHKPGSPAAQEH